MGFILGLIIALLMLGAGGGAYYLFYTDKKKANQSKSVNAKKKKNIPAILLAALVPVLLVVFIFIPFGFQQVETGEIAVVKVWGEAKETKSAGIHFRNVVSTKYEIYDAKVQQLEITSEVYTKDAQPSVIELVVQFKINTDKVVDISRTYGTMDVLKTRIERLAIEKAKVVLADKTAMKLIETRSELSPAIMQSINEIAEQYFISIEATVITDMAFSDAFEKAVEDKMIAEQKKLEAEYAMEQAIIKAEENAETARIKAASDLVVAQKNAEVALAKAKGDAEAQIAIAEGMAKATKLQYLEQLSTLGIKLKEVKLYKDNSGSILRDPTVTTGLTYYGTEYIVAGTPDNTTDQIEYAQEYMRFIKYLETWDGKLPTVIGDGAGLGGIIVTP